MQKHPLHPDETIQKILISTTSRLIGEYEGDNFLLTHAWQNFSHHGSSERMKESPVSRSAYIIIFKTPSYEKAAGVVVPDYTYIGEISFSLLSVLFGKRFDLHGAIESSGMYQVPNLNIYNHISSHEQPFNSHKERKNFPVPLNLENSKYILDVLINGHLESEFELKLLASSKFYSQALQICEEDPEVAYLHLITAGEIISEHFNYEKESLIDEKTLSYLKRIEAEIDDGEKIVKHFKSQFLSIKKRYVKSILSLIDDEFFISSEADNEIGSFKKEDFEKNIKASYDLRSKYVHTGVSFGKWIQVSGSCYDIRLGKPVVNEKEFSKVLKKAPTFNGLERVIRYCLLKFMILNGFDKLKEYNDNKE